MLYALDKRTGRIIFAESPHVQRWGLVCPNPKCGALVFLRAGGYRVPHFAHSRWSASDECDLYYPFFGKAPSVTEIYPTPDQATEHKNIHPLRELALFIRTNPDLSAALLLRIPAARQEIRWSGEIHCATPSGEARYRQEYLAADRFVDVRPQLQRYQMKTVGEVDQDYGRLLTDGINGISTDKSLFRVDDGFGKRLGWNEELYWGESLVVVFGSEASFSKFMQFVTTASLEYQPLKLLSDFKCVELVLPEESDESLRAGISDYLEREIRPSRARILVLDPPPHHFSENGEWVVASGAEQIRLYRSRRENVIVLSGVGSSIPVQEISDDTVEFSIEHEGNYNASIGSDSINIRVEYCRFNQTFAVRLRLGDQTYPLEEFATSKELREQIWSNLDEVSLEFDNTYISTICYLNGNLWPGNEVFRQVLRDTSLDIVLNIGSYLTIEIHRTIRLDADEQVGHSELITDTSKHALRAYFTNYQMYSRHRTPIGTAESKTTTMPMDVSIGVIPHLRWLNRRGK